MIVHASIVSECDNKHFPTNQYWEFNPNSVYVGSIELEVTNVVTSIEKYDLGLWTSGDGNSCSLVFLHNNDYTAYHSVPIYINGIKQHQQNWDQYPNHPLSVINKRIYTLAQEQGLLTKLGN